MAKLAFTKLGLKKNDDVKTILFNGNEIAVKQYLSMDEKVDLVSSVLRDSQDGNNFYNPMRGEAIKTLYMILFYTNITFTDKQKEDIGKLYDLFIESKLYELIISEIPKEEYNFVNRMFDETINSFYKYKSSVLGIIEAASADYANANYDATEIQQKLANPNNLALLKDILTKLG